MAKKQTPKATAPKGAASGRKSTGSGSVRTRALGEAADGFGKEIAPLGPRAGAVTLRVGNVLLGMLEGAVFGLEQVSAWMNDAVSKRLEGTPEEDIVPPNPRIAVPAVQALIYSMNDEIIREMFANLLAANMDKKKQGETHPAFIEIIKEMTPLDAQAIQEFRGANAHIVYSVRFYSGNTWFEVATAVSLISNNATVDELLSTVNNLERLGLLDRKDSEYPLRFNYKHEDNKDDNDRRLEEEFKPVVDARNAKISTLPPDAPADAKRHAELRIHKVGIYLSPLGRAFLATCLPSV